MTDTAIIDRPTLMALRDFKDRLARRYGNRLKGVYLFGSRARGNYRPGSDADVAVFLDHVSDPGAVGSDRGELSDPACHGDKHPTLGLR